MEKDNLNLNNIYILTSNINKINKNDIIKNNTLDLLIDKQLDKIVYSISLDDYLISMSQFTAEDYKKSVEEFDELYNNDNYYYIDSIKKAYEYFKDSINHMDLYVYKDEKINEIDGESCLDKIINVFDNSTLEKEYKYLLDFINYYKEEEIKL